MKLRVDSLGRLINLYQNNKEKRGKKQRKQRLSISGMGEVISLQGLYMLKKKIKECDEQFYVYTLYSSDEMGKFFKDTDYQSSLKKQQIT